VPAKAGLTSPVVTVDAPTAKIFFEALKSREWECPQCGHSHSRSYFLRLTFLQSQTEQILLEAYHLSILTTFLPYL